MNRDRMRLILTLPRNGRSKENKDTMDYFGDRFRRQTEEISELQEKVNVLYICSQTFFPLFSIENGFPSCTKSSVYLEIADLVSQFYVLKILKIQYIL